MPKKKKVQEKPLTAKEKAFHQELIEQMSKLTTSGFGLVVALAWNSAIQDFVKEFIEPRVPGSGLAYKFIYALIITLMVVLFTYYLSKISAKFVKKD